MLKPSMLTHAPWPAWIQRRIVAALGTVLLATAALSAVACGDTGGHHVGDTISNKEVTITLVSVMVLADDPAIAVAPGAERVQVHVKYTSHTHTVLNFNEAQFAVSNGAASCGDCMYPKAGTYFTFGDPSHAGYALAPGATIESDIVFEIPKSEHDARLLYQPDGMEGIAAFWWQLGI